MIRYGMYILAVVAVAGLFGLPHVTGDCGSRCKGDHEHKEKKPEIPDKLDFTLTDQDGEKVTLGDHAGKIIVLEWLNPDCPYVKRHYKAGTMKNLAKKYEDQGVVWLTINSTHYYNQKENKKFHKAHDLGYPILDDHEGKVGKQYDAKTTPHMFIISRKCEIVYQGAIDNDPRGRKKEKKVVNYVSKALDELLAGKEVEIPEIKPYGCSVKYPPKEKK